MQEPEAAAGKAGTEKKGYVGIHATGFKELMLKPELLQAITDCGFEHPSEGAHAAVDAAIARMVSGQPACRCACKLTMAHMLACRLQCSMSASRTRSWGWMCCARPSQAWARRRCLCCRSCSSLSPRLARCQRWCCATRESWLTRCTWRASSQIRAARVAPAPWSPLQRLAP